jgi:hypothetical protein
MARLKSNKFYIVKILRLCWHLRIFRLNDNCESKIVDQFRAATPDLPGIAKATAATSFWCKRLGVDAIISTNNIKGDDSRLKVPGILKLESFFWMNRKIAAEWSDRSVGTQVKGTRLYCTAISHSRSLYSAIQILYQRNSTSLCQSKSSFR